MALQGRRRVGTQGARRGRRVKAISIRNPWAWLIPNGEKDVENRTWYTSYRGPLLIHASKTVDREAYEALRCRGIDMPALSGMPTGGIVGKAVLVDCRDHHESAWYDGEGFVAWVLEEREPLPFVACRGRLGLFEVSLHE